MSAMMNLAKRRAAMVVGDFDFRNNGAPLTALPAILTALNATYTRNSVKNVVQNGALVSLSANQFGTSYDPVAATYGYVPEPAATNLATYSNDLSNAAWIKIGASASYAQGPSPDGSNNASKIIDTAVAEIHYVTPPAVSFSSGTVYTQSCYAKAAGINYLQIGLPAGSFAAANRRAVFNLSAGVVTSAEAGVTALIVDVGSGWYRCSITATANANSTQSGHLMLSRSGALNDAYLGNGIDGVLVYNAQIETGSRATSPIYTAGSTASRSADVLTVPLWINNIKDSQDGSTANWTRTNCTVTTSGTAPDGTATAQLVTVTTTAATTLNNISTKAPAKSVVASAYIKQGNRSTANLVLRNSSTATSFTTGILTFATGAITGAGWSAIDVGNGWYRCIYTSQAGDAISVGDALYFALHFAGASYTSGDTGYFWGAQIEPGAVATAYRPTTSTLESAANANITGFSSAAYTLACDARNDVLSISQNRQILGVHDQTGAFDNYASISNLGSAETTIRMASKYATASQSLLSFAGSTNRFKAAFKVENNAILGAASGSALAPDNACTNPTNLTVLNLGSLGGLTWNGFLFRAQLVTQALTQAQINGLTQ